MTRQITIQEEQAYRLCSPDYYGLTYANAALLMHVHLNTVYRLLKRLKAKTPQLFYDGFIRPRTPRNTAADLVYYESWMDNEIKQKF